MRLPRRKFFAATAAIASWIALFAVTSCVEATDDEIRVAAASNFAVTARELAAAFERESALRVRLSSASTGSLYAQIVNGAPYDVLFAADAERPRLLEAAGRAVPGSRRTYAVGRLALWFPRAGKSDCVEPPDEEALSGSARIAMANPDTAPYGAAARDVLASLDLLAALEGRIVYGENVAQAYQFAATGNVSAAFVAVSQFEEMTVVDGCVWIPPGERYTSIRQQAVLIDRPDRRPSAERFIDFVFSEAGRRIIERHGYGPGDVG